VQLGEHRAQHSGYEICSIIFVAATGYQPTTIKIKKSQKSWQKLAKKLSKKLSKSCQNVVKNFVSPGKNQKSESSGE
jgi:hypothetical protein